MKKRIASAVFSVTMFATRVWADIGPHPHQPGPHGVGHVAINYIDQSRGNRVLPTDIWYPIDPNTTEGVATRYPFPYSERDVARIRSLYIQPIESAPVAEDGPFPLVIISHKNYANDLPLRERTPPFRPRELVPIPR